MVSISAFVLAEISIWLSRKLLLIFVIYKNHLWIKLSFYFENKITGLKECLCIHFVTENFELVYQRWLSQNKAGSRHQQQGRQKAICLGKNHSFRKKETNKSGCTRSFICTGWHCSSGSFLAQISVKSSRS